ncbi:MAG: hypothetical protein WAU91_16355 [Desulfatitalea sp.]
MKKAIQTLAIYTTIYPGVEPFLGDWYRSLHAQEDRGFQLWIGLDTMSIADAVDAMGVDPAANWIQFSSGSTPAQIRQLALSKIVETCDGVILVDSDDVLHPSRVSGARAALQTSDLVGCPLRLVDQDGRDLGATFELPSNAKLDEVLPRYNIFGLSNSAYRSAQLRQCLPIPSEVRIVDWFLATKAWLVGARMLFETVVRMDYRQHSANMTRVRPPFDPRQIIRDTECVRHHFQTLRSALPFEGAMAERIACLNRVAADVELFQRQVVRQPDPLERYTRALNDLKIEPLWWSSVAHPSLQYMWNSHGD